MKKRKKEKRNEAISYQRWGTSALQPRGKGNRMGALQHFNLCVVPPPQMDDVPMTNKPGI